MRHENSGQFSAGKPRFGTWLISQIKRDDAVGALAKAAFADRRFPRAGDLKDVWAYINGQQPDGETIEALEDAELDWSSF